MKKFILLLLIVLSLSLFSCKDNKKDVNYIFEKMQVENVSYFVSSQGALSSCINLTENKSLINYYISEIKKVEFTKKVNKIESNDEVGGWLGTFEFYLSETEVVCVYDTKDGYYYLSYYNLFTYNEIIYKSKKYSPVLLQHLYYEVPLKDDVLTSELDCELSVYNQRFVVSSFIYEFSDLSKYYTDGVLFSGNIRTYLGEYNGYYACIVDGGGFEYEKCINDVVVNNIHFTYYDTNQIYLFGGSVTTLEEAFNKKLITSEDLHKIKINYENSIKGVIDFDLIGNIESISIYSNNKYTQCDLADNSFDPLFDSLKTKTWSKAIYHPAYNKSEKYDLEISFNVEIRINSDSILLLDRDYPIASSMRYTILVNDDEGYIIMDYVMFSTNSHALIAELNTNDLYFITTILSEYL